MKLISAAVPIVALSCCVAGSAVAAGTAKLSAPSKAHVGDSITAKGSGLKNGGSYALRLVDDAQPTQGASCLARIGKRQVASGGKVKISGTIPKKVTCYQGNGTKLGKIPVTPGKYHLLLSVPNGPTGSSAKYSFVRKALTVKKG